MHDLIVFDSGNYTNFNANTKGVEVALESHWTNGIEFTRELFIPIHQGLFSGLVRARFTQ